MRAGGRPGTGDGQFTRLLSVALDEERGRLYTLEDRNARVQAFDLSGRFTAVFGAGDFVDPGGITVAPDGTVFVTDYGLQRAGDGLGHIVRAYDPGGRRVAEWGERGFDPGQLTAPTGIAVDATGRVHVVDSGNQRVQVFDAKGAPLEVLAVPQLQQPGALALGAGGRVYVTELRGGGLHILRRS